MLLVKASLAAILLVIEVVFQTCFFVFARSPHWTRMEPSVSGGKIEEEVVSA